MTAPASHFCPQCGQFPARKKGVPKVGKLGKGGHKCGKRPCVQEKQGRSWGCWRAFTGIGVQDADNGFYVLGRFFVYYRYGYSLCVVVLMLLTEQRRWLQWQDGQQGKGISANGRTVDGKAAMWPDMMQRENPSVKTCWERPRPKQKKS